MIPCTFTLCEFYSTDTLMIGIAITETLGYYTTIATNCIIALERLSLFFCKPVNNFITNNYILIILLPWIWGCTIAISTTAMGCYKRFNRWTLQYTFECSNCDIFNGFNVTHMLFASLQIIVLIMLFGYISIIVQTCFGMSLGRRQKPVPLIFQCFAICILQWLSATVFFIGGSVFGYNIVVSIMSAMICNAFIVGNASVNAVVSLLFNKTIRQAFVHLFSNKRRQNSTVDIAVITRIHPVLCTRTCHSSQIGKQPNYFD
uniref:G_PROTEIN_RECEP_F1_2 domain-containing protein n=1 Tax=Syphacia muris TaxID=451379 RepID=A0A0N5AWL0_9BILA